MCEQLTFIRFAVAVSFSASWEILQTYMYRFDRKNVTGNNVPLASVATLKFFFFFSRIYQRLIKKFKDTLLYILYS